MERVTEEEVEEMLDNIAGDCTERFTEHCASLLRALLAALAEKDAEIERLRRGNAEHNALMQRLTDLGNSDASK